MVAGRWHGNGLAEASAITSTAIANTAGNGDTVSYGTSGATGSMVTAGDGFEAYGTSTADIKRLDAGSGGSITAARSIYAQVFVTPRAAPGTGEEPFIDIRSAGTRAGAVRINTNDAIRIGNSATVVIATGPNFVYNQKYQFDVIITLSASPTTSNGRIIVRAVNLNSPSWNTTGDWFYDSGYTVNMGTTNPDQIRVGKIGGGTWSSSNPTKFEYLGWDSNSTDLSGLTTRAAISNQFLISPYSAGNFMSFV